MPSRKKERLTHRERRFLEIIYPEGTISVGLSVGYELKRRGLVTIAKYGRYGITEKGIAALHDATTPDLFAMDATKIENGRIQPC